MATKIEPNPYVQQNNDRNLIRQRFPRASDDFIKINSDRVSHGPEPKSTFQRWADGQAKGKKALSGRYVISVTAYRARLCDPDNLCAKYFVDSLRYAGIIPDDREEDIIYSIRQKKAKKSQEKTLIEIWQEQDKR